MWLVPFELVWVWLLYSGNIRLSSGDLFELLSRTREMTPATVHCTFVQLTPSYWPRCRGGVTPRHCRQIAAHMFILNLSELRYVKRSSFELFFFSTNFCLKWVFSTLFAKLLVSFVARANKNERLLSRVFQCKVYCEGEASLCALCAACFGFFAPLFCFRCSLRVHLFLVDKDQEVNVLPALVDQDCRTFSFFFSFLPPSQQLYVQGRKACSSFFFFFFFPPGLLPVGTATFKISLKTHSTCDFCELTWMLWTLFLFLLKVGRGCLSCN